MWLKILDFMGLTNLTDAEVYEYYERDRKLRSRATDEENKELNGNFLERCRFLIERVLCRPLLLPSHAFKVILTIMCIFIAMYSLNIAYRLRKPLNPLSVHHNDRITVFVYGSGGPKRNFIIEGPGDREVRTDENGMTYINSRWIDQYVMIRDPNDPSISIQKKLIRREDENIIHIFIPSSVNSGRENFDQIKDMLYRPSVKKNDKRDTNEPNSGDKNE